ncbi:MAG: Asp-tRNA(Asn)/Glu-tRNA(Gln) amidotransferase subunit GatC [Xylanivirga thermophila]|jgi:aspartyl-tRNA(Asn)/glutamyl-tRNA(Gln) amidotransferase subunit C|uniref:Asp-tRNA(Asn)/Glu-tRNA(Gln) amidotransferase subunit GatC n=1 Tax=Xylanivirga thermophila TaxID=2496273 RepID=UPI00101CB23B|nr:Asp-tRNA(Asn)/Glu-tRNA(Gln) amidotransferase subunit GatC [Xylanivirga thermophila]
MKVSIKEVEHVANLSQLILNDDEKEKVAHDLSEILEYADKLSELDTDGIQPTIHVLHMQNVFREDVVKPSMDRDVLLENAPDAQDGCFKVPKVVE